ncbi:MAG: glycosyltransferase family 2 protein [Verrucomicrobiales bacterium]|nr:glycosyltransferase family 2 protein [Verrucomicrobiales bacterium]
MKYILITPARNEEAFIRKTLDSVTAQTQHPLGWVIVNDGSKDRTGEIAEEYAVRFPWITVIHRPQHLDRSFAGKVQAFNAGFERIRGLDFGVVGNLDADISFEPDYFEFLARQFDADPKLGVAGTPFTQDGGYDSAKDSFEGESYVAGGCQLFRAECFEEIGGYVPNPSGGIDWIAVMTARMKRWTVRSFPQKRFHHYRSLGTAETSAVGAAFDYGERAYFLGGSAVWHMFRSLYRMGKKPYGVGGMALMLGYVWASIRRVKRPVSREMIRFHRREQMQKLRTIIGLFFRLKRVDSFTLAVRQRQTSVAPQDLPPTP